MAHRIATWAAYLTVGTLATAVVMLLPDSAAQDVGYVVVAASGAVAVAIGPRVHHPHAPGAWYLVAAGLVAWAGGETVAALRRWTTIDVPVEPDALRLGQYVLVALGLWLFARSRTTERRLPALLETAVLTTALAMVATVFLVIPALASSEDVDRWLDAAFPIGNVLLLAALVRLSYAEGAGRWASALFAVLLGSGLLYQAISQVFASSPSASNRPQDLATQWLLPFVIAGAVSLHPSMRALSAPVAMHADHTHSRQVIGMGLALAAGPATMGVQHLAGVPLSAGTVAIFYIPLVCLVTWRILVLVGQINNQAISDDLTGLPNRRALHRAGQLRLSDAQDEQALLLLDLDRFKEVNDSLGHHAGDELLVQVAARLRGRLRADDLLARLGGDEFAVLLEGAGAEAAERIAADLSACLDAPFDLGELTVHTSASIGIALFPDHGTDLSTLMRKADVAMYRAKASGGYRMHGGGDGGDGRLRLSEEFRTALVEDQLVLHYQPKLDLDSGRVRGVEALVRWQHPERGLLQPADFLERVEEAGLMRAMTRVVLEKALDQSAVWRVTGRELTVAVNLSASSLVEVELPARITAMLAERDLPPSVLQLEITEEFLMGDRARARSILTALRAAGITIAVDDYGTGYSSLSYLRDLPLDELKLDRSFISLMAGDPRAAALVSSTIALAHSLGMQMVAEGVEDGTAYDELSQLGCDQAQGYFMSRPLPPDELEVWFRGRPVHDDAMAAKR